MEPDVGSVLLSQFSMAGSLSHISHIAKVPVLSTSHCSALTFKKLHPWQHDRLTVLPYRHLTPYRPI